MANMTRKEILESRATHAGVKLSTWNPGDGVTRYRIHPTEDEYFRAGGSELSLIHISEPTRPY